jgi:hypothetical protein
VLDHVSLDIKREELTNMSDVPLGNGAFGEVGPSPLLFAASITALSCQSDLYQPRLASPSLAAC